MKKSDIKLIVFPIVTVLMLGTIWFFVLTQDKPKTAISYESVWSILESNGYTPTDLTKAYQEKWSLDDALQKAVNCETENLQFNFFAFDRAETAENISKQYQTYIKEKGCNDKNTLVSKKDSDYFLYTAKANGTYTINMRVSDTVVFAYCKEENEDLLNRIMRNIGYFYEENK